MGDRSICLNSINLVYRTQDKLVQGRKGSASCVRWVWWVMTNISPLSCPELQPFREQ